MTTGKNAPQMKSQIMVGMIRCFIAEQEIVMFLSGNYNWPDKWM
ncbi:hypothetical protein M099_2834 [Phocaeicola vulgatus str. 3975 RP4]|uniref:Uncharacterized protein n=1 Tax=Phocaeicola vulgatus str. 3975 RP4 TaxID=1339352 RepID=A0A069SGL4_PHOVU|nr:hypothetical protein M099_2834 [Phocaeicola vulgatus str. 3975 RP4]